MNPSVVIHTSDSTATGNTDHDSCEEFEDDNEGADTRRDRYTPLPSNEPACQQIEFDELQHVSGTGSLIQCTSVSSLANNRFHKKLVAQIPETSYHSSSHILMQRAKSTMSSDCDTGETFHGSNSRAAKSMASNLAAGELTVSTAEVKSSNELLGRQSELLTSKENVKHVTIVEEEVSTEKPGKLMMPHPKNVHDQFSIISHLTDESEEDHDREYGMTKIPESLKKILYKELYPVIENTAKAYSKGLGNRHQLSIQAKEKLQKMEDFINNSDCDKDEAETIGV